uniref:Uncharacterized protein n=1 Tax=Pipistrellus kuhlii TaxID=59472 RepID=A0A7J7XUX4_PIPKU|nr:hypothetical protein mPipKuh1_010431 [Pipistrellus kuhlii]
MPSHFPIKVNSSMILSNFSGWCNYHHKSILEFYQPSKFPHCPFICTLPILSLRQPLIDFLFLSIFPFWPSRHSSVVEHQPLRSRFDSRSGHMPGLQAHAGGSRSMILSHHWCIFHSLPSPSSIK